MAKKKNKKLSTQTMHTMLQVPLFHVTYNCIVGNGTDSLMQHADLLFPGLNLAKKIKGVLGGYTCLITSNKAEELVIMINTDVINAPGTVERRIAHECLHLSWYILDAVGITITSDNHEIQAYLIESLIEEVNKAVKKNMENEISDFDSL